MNISDAPKAMSLIGERNMKTLLLRDLITTPAVVGVIEGTIGIPYAPMSPPHDAICSQLKADVLKLNREIEGLGFVIDIPPEAPLEVPQAEADEEEADGN